MPHGPRAAAPTLQDLEQRRNPMKDLRSTITAIFVVLGATAGTGCFVEIGDDPDVDRPGSYTTDAELTCDKFDSYLLSCSWFCVATTWDCTAWYNSQALSVQLLLDDCADCLYDYSDSCAECYTEYNERCSDVLADYLGQAWCG
jgi:hypothetical protein